ncbi:HAMP domain-containing sensor histidine kinase [Acrocarpospora pleiomorpha]|uniref:sensor histidine kinase n=1 Tax=Acrocarpospora pleiomorpha TaxID=90975 RepID=UPI0031D8DA96
MAALLCATLVTVLMVTLDRFTVGALTEEVAAAGKRVATQMGQGRLQYPLADHPHRNIQVVDARGAVVASTPQLQGKPAMTTFMPAKVATTVVCGGVFPSGQCDIVVAQRVHRGAEHWIVYASSPTISPWVDPQLAALIGGAVALLAVGITYLGNRVATASLRPVRAISSELDEINAACPNRRVPVPPTDDEIHDLATSVNHTLSRLHTALKQQRQMVADVSHDLRTPITAIRAEVEDALYAPQETSVTRLGKTLMGGLDRLQAITRDLATMAKLDSGAPDVREPIALSTLVATELRARRTTKRIEHALDPEVWVAGDCSQLARLLASLVENAERHASTTIKVTVRKQPGDPSDDQRFPDGVAVLEVLDDGSGIPPHQRELVFQRFTRLDAARTRDAGGAGLGLPIARQIAEALGGTLHIEDSPRGARFVLYLPILAVTRSS